MQPWAANLDSTIAEPVCPPGPLLGMMNLNWGTIAPYSANVGPRRGAWYYPLYYPYLKVITSSLVVPVALVRGIADVVHTLFCALFFFRSVVFVRIAE